MIETDGNGVRKWGQGRAYRLQLGWRLVLGQVRGQECIRNGVQAWLLGV
jgi:hypothetical protein